MAFDKIKYDNEYVRQNYDRIEFTIPKGRKDDLKALAIQEGLSISQLVVKAIQNWYGIDLSK